MRQQGLRNPAVADDVFVALYKASVDVSWLRGGALDYIDQLGLSGSTAREGIEDLSATLVELKFAALALESSGEMSA